VRGEGRGQPQLTGGENRTKNQTEDKWKVGGEKTDIEWKLRWKTNGTNLETKQQWRETLPPVSDNSSVYIAL